MIEYKIESVPDSDQYIIHRRLNLFFFAIRLQSYTAEFKEGSSGYQMIFASGDGLFLPVMAIPIELKGKLEYFGQWNVSRYRGPAYTPEVIAPNQNLRAQLNEIKAPYRDIRRAAE